MANSVDCDAHGSACSASAAADATADCGGAAKPKKKWHAAGIKIKYTISIEKMAAAKLQPNTIFAADLSYKYKPGLTNSQI